MNTGEFELGQTEYRRHNMSLSSKRPASSPGGVKRSNAHKGSCRGLLIRGSHLQKFFDPVLDRKTHEVRSFNCRCVSKGGEVWLVESGVKDSAGRGVFRIWARAEFRGNTTVSFEDFSKHYQKHRCTGEQLNDIRATWSSEQKACVLWELLVKERLADPVYVAPKQGEET